MPQAEVKFDLPRADAALIAKILQRALHDYPDAIDDPLSLTMDLTACHANGCPLDLQRLLDGEAFSFAHDVFGIANHMDRETGKLLHHFVPRYAA